MKYLDSNVLIRLITNDQPSATPAVSEFINSQKKDSLMILDAVLVEVCFVLQFNRYKMARTDIFEALLAILKFPQVVTSKNSQRAIELFGRHPKLDYVDCLLLVLSNEEHIYTLDKELQAKIDRG